MFSAPRERNPLQQRKQMNARPLNDHGVAIVRIVSDPLALDSRRRGMDMVGMTPSEWTVAVTWCRVMLLQTPDSMCWAIADGAPNDLRQIGQST